MPTLSVSQWPGLLRVSSNDTFCWCLAFFNLSREEGNCPAAALGQHCWPRLVVEMSEPSLMWGLCSLSGWDFSCHCGYRGHNWSLWWAAGTGPGANDPSFQCELLLLRFWFWWDTSADTAMEHILSQGLKCVFWTASTTLFWSSLKGREVKLYTNEFFSKSHPAMWRGEGGLPLKAITGKMTLRSVRGQVPDVSVTTSH